MNDFEGLLHNVERLVYALDEVLDAEIISLLETEWVGLSQCRKTIGDAQLIAQAPTLLDENLALKTENEQLKQRVAELKEERDQWCWDTELEALKALNAELLEALEAMVAEHEEMFGCEDTSAQPFAARARAYDVIRKAIGWSPAYNSVPSDDVERYAPKEGLSNG